MCGIFGYVGKIETERGLYCTRTLAHRGPDGEGHYAAPGIFLGHRRLSIIDLTDGGKQPMSYANGRYWITFNGEIYNFLEIRQELVGLGHTFKSDSDTEVILAAFLAWGPECLHKFNGMWALAIWDNKERSLFLSRDRFGKKPLFYSQLGSDFAFASEMKALAPLLPKIEVNQRLIDDIAHIFYYESTDACLIKGIERFPAGHYGWYKDGKLSLTRYWRTLDHLVDVPEKYEDQVAQFRELFLDAVKIRMRADVSIGTALSGGLDSSAVFGAVARLSREGAGDRASKDWQHAFSASFPGTPLDELEWARKVAEHCGAPISPVIISPEDHLATFYEDIYRFEDLYITPHIPFMATYGAMKQAGVTVTLDGHGADELFGGYSFDYLHILHDEMWNFQNSKSVIDTYYESQLTDGAQFGTLPPKSIFWVKQFAKNAAKKILGRNNVHPDSRHPRFQSMDYFTQKLYISFHQTVLPTLLRNYDRYSMARGVEIRMPFMDHRIVSYAFSLPWQSKVRNGYTKSIVRDAVADLMPQDVAYRKTKIGFNAPMVDWFKGPMRNFFNEIQSSKNFKDCNLIEPISVTRNIENIITDPNATFHQAEHAWQMLTPFLWQEGFLNRITK
jgi:asparagine synthase (glutamine-hydrolysing)